MTDSKVADPLPERVCHQNEEMQKDDDARVDGCTSTTEHSELPRKAPDVVPQGLPEQKQNFGRALRFIRAALDMSQKDLGEAMQLGPSMLSLLEAGARQPSIETLDALAKVAQLPLWQVAFLSAPDAELQRPENIGTLEIVGGHLLRLSIDSAGGK